jgi:hypothetical protein
MTVLNTLRATRRGVAMSQYIPDGPVPDRPLRRRTDRLQTALGWMLVLAGLVTLLAAALTAASAYRDGLDRVQRDAAARTTVVGVLLDDASPIGAGPQRPVRVSYVDPMGRAHVGQVPVTGRLLAGTSVRVEVDGDGRVGVEPPSRGDAVLSAVTAAIGVTLLGGVLLVLSWVGIRQAIAAHNHGAWEREWRQIEPRWSGRGRRV